MSSVASTYDQGRQMDEAVVRAAWADVLEHEDFSDHDNFFTVGGQSIRALQVMRDLSSTLETRLPVRLLLEHPTVTELTTAVRTYLDQPRD